jgi:hypothetical protein
MWLGTLDWQQVELQCCPDGSRMNTDRIQSWRGRVAGLMPAWLLPAKKKQISFNHLDLLGNTVNGMKWEYGKKCYGSTPSTSLSNCHTVVLHPPTTALPCILAQSSSRSVHTNVGTGNLHYWQVLSARWHRQEGTEYGASSTIVTTTPGDFFLGINMGYIAGVTKPWLVSHMRLFDI